MKLKLIVLLLALSVLPQGLHPCAAAEIASIETAALDVSLTDADGNAHPLFLSEVGTKLHVICILGTECPLAKLYGPRLQEMATRYASDGVRFVGVNSNVQDSKDDLSAYVEAHQVKFPVVKDYDRSIAKALGATRTPEVIVLDRAGTVVYRGRIDDQYLPGVARPKPSVHHLRDAIDASLAGKKIEVRQTEPVGCLIAMPRSVGSASNDITYCNQVARILQKHCVECHREGEIGPFHLDEYDEIVGWADMSLEVIEQGRMPPWHADPNHGEFANTRHMTDTEKRTLTAWVDAGMPYGDAADLPAAKQYVKGWQLERDPDLVLKMSDTPFDVPATGTVEYQYFVVDPKFKKDVWIRGAEVIPGNRAVVHHCITFVRPPDGSDFRDIGLLAGYVPGQRQPTLPEGFATRVRAGSKFVFQMHYTPTGKPESDITKIGLLFEDDANVTHEVFAIAGIEQEFEIEPHDKAHRVSADVGWFPKDGFLLSITPHMHVRGKSFEMTARSQDGTNQKLLSVPQYDFNWQHNYQFVEPMELSSVEAIDFTAVFDNSADNPTNPDPTEYVTWGDQTWQEMAVAFLAVAEPRQKSASIENAKRSKEAVEEMRRIDLELLVEAEAFADAYIKRFDKNGDGRVTTLELPRVVQRYSYLDHNRDGEVSRHELVEEQHWRLQNRYHKSR